jgi:hypothetical protein
LPASASHLDRSVLLAAARARLEPLALYPRPPALAGVRIAVTPLLFRLPWLRRFDGYALWGTILLRRQPGAGDADLVCHELCHIWQLQHHPLRMPLSYLRHGYGANPYEQEARQAVAATRG